MRTVFIILAAGKGLRAGAGTPKQHRAVAGRSPLLRALLTAQSLTAIAATLVVRRAGDAAEVDATMATASSAVAGGRLMTPVVGGAERQQSVANALEALADAHDGEPAPSHVLIHDAARPFAPPDMIGRVLDALAAGAEAACPVLPVVDTLRAGLPHPTRPNVEIAGPVADRAGLRRAQTPQGFAFAPLLAAHRALKDRAATDDAELARLAGLTVVLTEGAEAAFKLTTPEDFERGAEMARRLDGER